MARINNRDQVNRDTALAWMYVAIDAKAKNDKRVPRLEDLMQRDRIAKPDPSAMKRAFAEFVAAHNAELAARGRRG